MEHQTVAHYTSYHALTNYRVDNVWRNIQQLLYDIIVMQYLSEKVFITSIGSGFQVPLTTEFLRVKAQVNWSSREKAASPVCRFFRHPLSDKISYDWYVSIPCTFASIYLSTMSYFDIFQRHSHSCLICHVPAFMVFMWLEPVSGIAYFQPYLHDPQPESLFTSFDRTCSMSSRTASARGRESSLSSPDDDIRHRLDRIILLPHSRNQTSVHISQAAEIYLVLLLEHVHIISLYREQDLVAPYDAAYHQSLWNLQYIWSPGIMRRQVCSFTTPPHTPRFWLHRWVIN